MNTDEQQCQGWKENSIKKALRLANGAGLFLFKEGVEGPSQREFSRWAAMRAADKWDSPRFSGFCMASSGFRLKWRQPAPK